ncbi:MAG: hypothetical protein KGO50_14130 [Myxococcales bacterium]|nr:hypothetical protein [Myxococcales bacterium]
MNREFAELLGYWIAQQRLAERHRDAAYADVQLWFKRLKLARQAGDERLMREAAARAEEARDRFELAGRRVKSAEVELAAVRATAQAPDRTAITEALRRSQHAIQEFQKLGILQAPDEFADAHAEPAAAVRPPATPSTAPSRLMPPTVQPNRAATTATHPDAFRSGVTEASGPRDRYADLPDDDLLDIEREALAMAEELMRERESGAKSDEPK